MAERWKSIHKFEDIKYDRTADGVARITINRPEVRNAFRPLTVGELKQAFDMARDDAEIGVVILTGEGPEAFCSGGDQRVRGEAGYFDGGLGSSYLARIVGQKKAREIWFLCRQYDAKQALDMGLVNTVVPLERLEDESVQWSREILEKSPTALRFLKAAFNADTDGLAGIQQLAGDATLLYYLTDEAKEGKNAFLEKRRPDFSQYPRFP